MEPVTLSQALARKIIIHAAGLSRKGQFGDGIGAVYQIVQHLGFVQLDTNYIVERAHHLVMAARIDDYQKAWLAELNDDGSIFEYFTSDSGYIPMSDFRFSLPVKQAFSEGEVTLEQARVMKEVIDRIEREGPLSVTDFEYDRTEASTGWWDWRPAKIALEKLYFNGELMISRTPAFKKVYDLPINIIPPDTDISYPAPEEFARYIITKTLHSLGLAGIKEMTWRARRVKGNLVKQELHKMVTNGEIKLVTVSDTKMPQLYMLAGTQTDVELSGDVFILSPFDIINVFRHRLKDFFNFDYQVECFVPAAKRKYGYFSLPVLAGDTFIARMDSKADRKNSRLIVHNIHFEPVNISKTVLNKYIDALKQFIVFNQCRDVVFERSNREDYLKEIKKQLE